jgi:phage baseplate assembly protein W
VSEPPEHLSYPFTITKNGAKTVEQDSPADIEDCVLRVALFPVGSREDLSNYGVPELTFQRTPLDLPTYEAAIEYWEPRAKLSSSEMAEGVRRARLVQIEVS